MRKFQITIGDKVTECTGTMIDDVNPRNNNPYMVYSVSDMRLDGKPVLSFVAKKDAAIRKEEQIQFDAEYEQEKAKAVEAWQARHPEAGTDEIAAYVEHWEGTAPARRLRRMRTNGLHVTIKDGDKTHAGYLMPEKSGGALAKFRTYVPQDAAEAPVDEVNPF